jgi:membrane associated rhomboid family serine protease/Flp pilus assembly protein TadD
MRARPGYPELMRMFPATTALIGINGAVFVAMVAAGVSLTEPTTEQLIRWGANFGPLALTTQPWRMLTANYVHIGILHILLNMWCLWNLGLLAERVFSRRNYLVIYTLCGLAGSVNSLWWHPLSVDAGASGAIFGLAGALITVLYLGNFAMPRAALRPILKSLVTFAFYNLVIGAVWGRIDNAGHIGGLVMGLAVGAAFAKVPAGSRSQRAPWWRAIFAAAAALLIASFLFVQRRNGYVAALARADDELSHSHYDKAIADLEPVIAAHPGDALALKLLGNAYAQKKDYARAEQVLVRALAIDPRDLAAQYYLGGVYLDSRQYEPARQVFQKIVDQNPRDDGARVFLANALEGLGRDAEAAQAYQVALATNPDNPEAARWVGLMQLRRGQPDQALATLRQAAQHNPKDARLQMALSAVYAAKGMQDEARTAAQKADTLREAAGAPPPPSHTGR